MRARSAGRAMPEHFVVIAGQPKQTGSDVVVVCAESARQAHEFAAADFRKKRGLAASVHVQTATAYRCDTEAEAALFFARIIERMDAASREQVQFDGRGDG